MRRYPFKYDALVAESLNLSLRNLPPYAPNKTGATSLDQQEPASNNLQSPENVHGVSKSPLVHSHCLFLLPAAFAEPKFDGPIK